MEEEFGEGTATDDFTERERGEDLVEGVVGEMVDRRFFFHEGTVDRPGTLA